MKALLPLAAALLATGCNLERTSGNWQYKASSDNAMHYATSNQGGQKA